MDLLCGAVKLSFCWLLSQHSQCSEILGFLMVLQCLKAQKPQHQCKNGKHEPECHLGRGRLENVQNVCTQTQRRRF